MQFVTPDHQHFARAHLSDWFQCKRCPLHEHRRNVVLWRGYIPADILFIGEAPGRVEDLYGYPFVGSSGQKLDEVIQFSQNATHIYKFCITNVVGCIPLHGDELRQPSDYEIHACKPRLDDLINSVNPRCIVLIGQVSKAAISIIPKTLPYVTMLHPSAILQMDESQRAFEFLRCVGQVVNAVEMYC